MRSLLCPVHSWLLLFLHFYFLRDCSPVGIEWDQAGLEASISQQRRVHPAHAGGQKALLTLPVKKHWNKLENLFLIQTNSLSFYCCQSKYQPALLPMHHQALDGFFIAIMTDGNILYVSESVTSLLEHLPVSNTGSFFSLVCVSYPLCCRTNIKGILFIEVQWILKGIWSSSWCLCLFSHVCMFIFPRRT